MVSRLVAAHVFVAVFGLTASAQGVQSNALFQSMISMVGKEPAATQRLKFSTSVRDYCRAILERVPRNSAKEQDWLNAELNSGESHRSDRALRSIEAARSILFETFSECVKHATEAGKNIRTEREAYYWVSLAKAFQADDKLKTGWTQLGFEEIQLGIGLLAAVRLHSLDAAIAAMNKK